MPVIGVEMDFLKQFPSIDIVHTVHSDSVTWGRTEAIIDLYQKFSLYDSNSSDFGKHGHNSIDSNLIPITSVSKYILVL